MREAHAEDLLVDLTPPAILFVNDGIGKNWMYLFKACFFYIYFNQCNLATIPKTVKEYIPCGLDYVSNGFVPTKMITKKENVI